jgi:hypothetical protein
MISMLNWDSSFFEIEKDGVTQRTSPLLQALTEKRNITRSGRGVGEGGHGVDPVPR